MPYIDIGDLHLPVSDATLQVRLFHAIRDKIVHGLWPMAGKLPSTRKLAIELNLSRNTIIATYEQLLCEGYIESKKGSGFYVSVELPEHYLSANKLALTAHTTQITRRDINASFAPGVPDLAQFPLKKWQRYVQRHSSRAHILGNSDIQGVYELRVALCDYLASSRSVVCTPDQIIITSGAQQGLAIAAMTTLTPQDKILLEQPGYVQVDKIMNLVEANKSYIDVSPFKGLNVEQIVQSQAKALYVTPSNQYPMGTTLNSEQRLKLIDWANQGQRWIIEDDYDSEFQFAHRPYSSMQGLAAQFSTENCVIYIGSFSKVMFNGLRLGYMVVPTSLLKRSLDVKDALSGDSPVHTQYALADFISEGELLRHIRKMRRLYKAKHQAMLVAIEQYFGQHVEVISQAAGLHITLRWKHGIDEETLRQRALTCDLIVRTLNYYQSDGKTLRDWHGIVLGFGNTTLEQIPILVARLATEFFKKN
ncbi:transcriptional regulator [Vibrio ichthyoenteri ATCC 700023]|uniref:Transcriptional regulator n=1 Tax=Vibrio ichthyoenteri ATCC 700023 TaxID=870968 RepID=F9S6B3_9VIBR|nr:PLP-dependent aminotransferase family protein [Vibrio ichthyoenteri]EGU33739.1 transcriptional regulator [Vibrio ichthyoenteri ATCC 700023]